MDLQRGLSANDQENVLDVVGGLDELVAAGKLQEARLFFLTSTQRLLGATAVFWTVLDSELRTSLASGPSGAIRTDIHGVDEWQLALWEKPFFEDGEYIENPLWEPLRRLSGTVRAYRRADVLSAAEWNAHPQNALGHALGFEDDVASMAPIGGGREVVFVGSTASGDPRFAERERQLLQQLTGATRWFFRHLVEPVKDDAGKLRLEGFRSRLAPHLRNVLDQLLTSRSEKEIAAQLGLSPRTVHKYTEHVFRTASVSSRIELLVTFCHPTPTTTK